jgi:hypothetical protein
MENGLNFELTFADEDIPQVLSALREAKAENIESVRQLGALGAETLVLAIIAVRAIANVIIKLLRVWKCGIVVDARGSRVLTRKNCDLPRGSVLVFTKKGEQLRFDQPSDFNIQGLIRKSLTESSGGEL